MNWAGFVKSYTMSKRKIDKIFVLICVWKIIPKILNIHRIINLKVNLKFYDR